MRPLSFTSRLLIVLLAIQGMLPVSAGSAARSGQAAPIPLQQAVESGQVEVSGIPIVAAVMEPNIHLTFKSVSGEPFWLELTEGAVFTSADQDFSPIILPESLVVETGPQGVDVLLLNLKSDVSSPTVLNPTEYVFSYVLDDARVLNLFHIAHEKSYGYGPDFQLALWATVEGKSLEEMVAGAQTKPAALVQQRAQCILDGGDCNLAQPQNPTLPPPPTVENKKPLPTVSVFPQPGPISGMTVLLILVGLGILIILAVVFFGKKRTPVDDRDRSDWSLESVTERKPNPPTPPVRSRLPPTPPAPPPPSVVQTAVSRVRLTGSGGPHRGHTFTTDLPFLLSRGGLEVVVVPESTISAPHAMLYLGTEGAEVKDMSSSNGVVVDGRRLPSDWQKLGAGSVLKLGKAEFSITGSSFQVNTGDAQGSTYGPFAETIVISREPLNVLLLGNEDGNISDAHVLFSLVDNQVQLRDLSSRYGTRVNGLEAARNQILQPGDRIQLGLSEFIFMPE